MTTKRKTLAVWPKLRSRATLFVANLFVWTVVAAYPALAHEGAVTGGGFATGFLHPIFGWDHVAAMVAVGLWGAFLGRPAIWILPLAFPLVMAIGAAMGIADLPLPGVELGIAASALVIGLAVALAARPPIWIAAVVVGFFALFHGHAHGTEMPNAANPMAYAFGFVMATGLLHVAGIFFGSQARTQAGRMAVRVAALAIAAVGTVFVQSALT